MKLWPVGGIHGVVIAIFEKEIRGG
jgi:hypothetical protein